MRLSIKILRRGIGTCRSLHACPAAVKSSQQPFLSGAGDLPINTDIPPQRAMHAKKGLTLLEGVLVSIFSWVAMRTDMVKSATCLPVSLCSHFCTVKLRLLEMSEKFFPPLLLFSFLTLPPSPTATGEDDPGVQERDQKVSLSPRGVNQSHRHWHRRHRGTTGWDVREGGGGSSPRLRLLQTPLISPVLSPSLGLLASSLANTWTPQGFFQQRWRV